MTVNNDIQKYSDYCANAIWKHKVTNRSQYKKKEDPIHYLKETVQRSLNYIAKLQKESKAMKAFKNRNTHNCIDSILLK